MNFSEDNHRRIQEYWHGIDANTNGNQQYLFPKGSTVSSSSCDDSIPSIYDLHSQNVKNMGKDSHQQRKIKKLA